MAKITRRELKPDDPIFTNGPQVFVPVSRPSTATSAKDTDGTNQSTQEDPMMGAREAVERQAMELASRDLLAPTDLEQEEKN